MQSATTRVQLCKRQAQQMLETVNRLIKGTTRVVLLFILLWICNFVAWPCECGFAKPFVVDA